MSFLKRIGSRSKSTVDFPEDSVKAQKKEEKKQQKRSSIQGLSGFRPRSERSQSVDGEGSVTAETTDSSWNSPERMQAARDRERKKYKDMSGVTAPVAGPANEYPTFLVHYLGRMPTTVEYGREAVEKPVEQLCKLREKQKLPRLMMYFNPEGMRCWEVSGAFLKTKKDGFNMSVPLHHITYGVGSNDHPNIFACIIRMNADPAPGEEQMLMLHAFICAKPEVTQKLTYWQLQAYIEAYEDLKRKRILRDRRKKALAGTSLDTPTPTTFTTVQEEPKEKHKDITEVKIKGKGKVKVKATVEADIQNGPSKAVGLVLQDGSKAPSSYDPSTGNNNDDESEVFVDPPGATTGTVVHRARIVSRPRVSSTASDDGGTATPPAPATSGKNGSREGSISSGEGDNKVDTSTLQRRIGDLQGFMEMDADMLKKLMVSEHPTLARRISVRTMVDSQGIFYQDKTDVTQDLTSEENSSSA